MAKEKTSSKKSSASSASSTKKKVAASSKEEAMQVAQALIDRITSLATTRSVVTRPGDLEEYRCINKLDAESQARVAIRLLQVERKQNWTYSAKCLLENARSSLLRRKKLQFSPAQMIVIVRCLGRYHYWPNAGLVGAIERYAKDNELREDARILLTELVHRWCNSGNSDCRKISMRLSDILGTEGDFKLNSGEAWSDVANQDLAEMSVEQRSAWSSLLNHCQSASGGKPSKKWKTAAEQKLGPVKGFSRTIAGWFALVDKPRNTALVTNGYYDPNLFLDQRNADVLKGLMWVIPLVGDPELARHITQVAVTAYKKVPGTGPRNVALGNSCLYALGWFDGIHGVAQLAILKVRVKFGTAQRLIEKALVETAERVGIPRSDLEEMSVPAYGLTDVGVLEQTLGEFNARLVISGSKAELQWFDSSGKQRKTVPTAVKNDFKEELAELKKQAREITKMIPAQVARVEQTYLPDKTWNHDTWKERYLDHPLVGAICRRLIWQFTSGTKTVTGSCLDGKLVDADDQRVKGLSRSQVKLWHPLYSNTDEVLAWRTWLEKHQVVQPFKQAHREVYLLTDAERNTETYSNRFAAHIVKQHQFHALCQARGWKNSLRLMVDDYFPPAHIAIPQHNLRAEFWVEGIGSDYGVDTNETGTYYYLATDQVRFYSRDAADNHAHAGGGGYEAGYGQESAQPLPLDKIPALVLSEILRDVDLFVGVASVGNDPHWNDGGPQGHYRDYWHDYSFGQLSATAETRKQLLETLIPRLKIAERCEILGRFLEVRGEVRTYRIHLGSGNILMHPNDQYLCIVPKQSVGKGNDKVFLPFEGDRTLSIIISKAFLLADDMKIKDPAIVSQIKAGK